MKEKLSAANELREMIDIARDSDSARVIPNMVPALLETLRAGQPSFLRDSPEYQFRRTLVDILHRIPHAEPLRGLYTDVLKGMLHLLRHDNEDIGVTCCKTMIELLRSYRIVTEDIVTEFMGIMKDEFNNMKGLVEEVLSEDSPVLDPNVVPPSIRSFKIVAELGMVLVSLSQAHRALIAPALGTTLPLNFEVLALESSAQKKARVEYEAMGSFWAGMSPTVKNPHAYVELINAQIKVIITLSDCHGHLANIVQDDIISGLHQQGSF